MNVKIYGKGHRFSCLTEPLSQVYTGFQDDFCFQYVLFRNCCDGLRWPVDGLSRRFSGSLIRWQACLWAWSNSGSRAQING